jgi:hypothetical protein
MGRIFQPGRIPTGTSAPEVQSMFFTTGQAFLKGAIVVPDAATGRIIEAAANPASIVGVALEAPSSKPGFSVNFDATVVARTGTVQEVSVAKANRLTIFTGRMVNGGTDPVTPVQADLDTAYGVLKTGAGEWVVNQADVATTRVRVIDIDIPLQLVFFRFLEANLTTP